MTEATETNSAQDNTVTDMSGRILDRLEAIEARLSRLETAPAAGSGLGRLAEEAGARARAAWAALAGPAGQSDDTKPVPTGGPSSAAAEATSGRSALATEPLQEPESVFVGHSIRQPHIQQRPDRRFLRPAPMQVSPEFLDARSDKCFVRDVTAGPAPWSLRSSAQPRKRLNKGRSVNRLEHRLARQVPDIPPVV